MKERIGFEREMRDLGVTTKLPYQYDVQPEDEVKALMTELRPLFQKNFSKNKTTYGPLVGTAVKFRIVADKDFKAEVKKEAERLAEKLKSKLLKFGPELVQRSLQRYYKALKKKFPDRLLKIDENTQLTNDEEVAVFTLAKSLTVQRAVNEADTTGGFYSVSEKEIVLRESQRDAGTIAHEMAHSYANEGWYDFISVMGIRGMKETDKLDEGMATYFERIVVAEWHKNQPSGTTIPLAGYDQTYTKVANDFVKALGKDLAYKAYFGGWVDYTDDTKPEDTLVVGEKRPKTKWKWLWR